MKKEKDTNINKLVIVMVFLIIVFIALTKMTIENNINNGHSKVDYTTLSELNFSTVYNAIQENEINAESTYKGNAYIFIGTIEYIKDDVFGAPYISVQQTSNDVVFSVTSYFVKNEKEYISKLKKGDTIKFYGVISDISPLFGFMTINDAHIIK